MSQDLRLQKGEAIANEMGVRRVAPDFADGLLRIKQVLAAYITGDTANSLVAQPVVDGNKVTVTLAGSSGATVQVLVEGY